MPEQVKRSKLPGASELFRPTVKAASARRKAKPDKPKPDSEVTSSGRVRHDEKITVYFSSEELIRLEDARLDLRRHHQLAVDRGRIVRATVALALADLAEHGPESALYRQLQQ